MHFTKMHGIGNDYVYVDCTKEKLAGADEIAKIVSDRHFGIGSDGLILINSSDKADFEMEMYNADGSRGKMCGNGIRCVGKYVYDHGLTNKTTVTVDTLGGLKILKLSVEDGKVTGVRVDMGEPVLVPKDIPMNLEGDRAIDVPYTIGGKEWRLTGVSMGNPHVVVFMDEDVAGLDIEKVGVRFEHDPLFPERVNTEFVNVIDREHVRMRVWERGSGETLACGTGACAVACACFLNGKTDRNVTVSLLGGDLIIEWDEETGHVFMTGPATEVFEGDIRL